jgi:DNA replication and repair protein RecF
VRVRTLWLQQFRTYDAATLDCPPGVCVLWGPNGVGKTNVLEAIGYLSSLRSFRHAPVDALVRVGADRAIIRGEVLGDGREVLIETDIARAGRNRVQLNRQRVQGAAALGEALRVTVFSPDDLDLVKGGPSLRRELVDDAAMAIRARDDAVRVEWEKVLRQRNALLKQVGGRLDDSARITLEVWDAKAAETGTRLAELRSRTVSRLLPAVQHAYADLGGSAHDVQVRYEPSWQGDLHEALVTARRDELRRGVTLVGPHRDDLHIVLNGLPARTHASQGEQRCLALALRLATHREVQQEHGSPPVLLLDDVFSELDPVRSAALVRALPEGQAFLTTAGPLPEGIEVDEIVEVSPGSLRSDRGGATGSR